MAAILRIHKDCIDRDFPELLDFIEAKFNSVVDITTFDDVRVMNRAFLIEDDRIRRECKELTVMMSTAPPEPGYEDCLLGKFKGEYYAWFDDGRIPYDPYKETSTSKLKESLDFQLDEYNRHTDPFCKELVLTFVKKLADEINRREGG